MASATNSARPFSSQTLRDALADRRPASAPVVERTQGRREDFWALRNVSFDVAEGEVVGIIGRNGAGKSTLLKILSRITRADRRRGRMRGRVGGLLEVGTGFHPELTGRENVFLNGAILGMSQRRDPAEVRRDRRVRRSRAVSRHAGEALFQRACTCGSAFAVAAHLEPEILIVDEVLAVGDAEFQRKCLGKMERGRRKAGRTVLFVSHNMAAIESLCSRCVLLKNGMAVIDSAVSEVISAYRSEKSGAWDPIIEVARATPADRKAVRC